MIRVTLLERGEVRTLEIEDESLHAFTESLATRGGSVIGVERFRARGLPAFLSRRTETWTSWFAALARTLKGGVPLDQSLELLAVAAPVPEQASRVHQDIIAGKRFSDSVGRHFTGLSPLIPALLRAGEAAGDLGRGASLAHRSLQDSATFRRELSARLAYPMVVVSASALALCVLLLKVFPAMAGMWSSLEKPFPPILVFMRWGGWVAVAILILFALGFGWLMGGSESAHRLPGFRTIGRHRHREEAWSALAMALGGGVSLIESLALFGERWGAHRLREAIQKGIRPETALDAWVDDAPGQKAILIASLRIGDIASGANSIAEGYREMLEEDLRSLQRWLEPAILMFLGSILMSLAWSLFSLMEQMENGLVR